MAALRSNLLALYKSTTLRATLTFAFAGVAYMLGNMLLARHLSELEFGAVALFLTFNQVGTSLGAIGADTVVTRHALTPTMRLLGTFTSYSTVVGVLLCTIAAVVYEMSVALALVTFASIVASALVRVEAAFYQSRRNFRASLFLHQSYNFMLLAVACGALLLGTQGAVLPCAAMTICFVVMAVGGWRSAVKSYGTAERPSVPYPWKDALPVVGFGAASVLSMQAERLLIPELLSVETLALYAVLTALAGSPFQMLMVGVGYTMMPRIKNAKSVAHRRKIVRNEALLISLVALVSVAGVLLLAPFLTRFLTAGKYELSQTLVAMVAVNGLAKVLNAFIAAVLRALGTTRDLHLLNYSSWIGLVIGVLAAIPGASFGLEGLILAVAFGWVARSLLLVPATVRVLADTREPLSETGAAR